VLVDQLICCTGAFLFFTVWHDYSVAPEAPVRNFEQQLSGKNSSALS
jgi:hypothetical protein